MELWNQMNLSIARFYSWIFIFTYPFPCASTLYKLIFTCLFSLLFDARGSQWDLLFYLLHEIFTTYYVNPKEGINNAPPTIHMRSKSLFLLFFFFAQYLTSPFFLSQWHLPRSVNISFNHSWRVALGTESLLIVHWLWTVEPPKLCGW